MGAAKQTHVNRMLGIVIAKVEPPEDTWDQGTHVVYVMRAFVILKSKNAL